MDSIASHSELALRAQTAYAQLYEASLSAETFRSIADLTGSFNAKTVKGAKYWYYQYKEPSGKLHQVYVGPDNDTVAALRERKRTPAFTASLGPLARAAAVLGCAEISFKHARVVSRLAEYGFFKAGGVLVGTHAFLAFGNMLGIRWKGADRTEDVDFAHAGRSLSLALPTDLRLSTDGAIESLKMGFLPTSSLVANQGGAYLNPNEPTFRLDFLMPRSRDGEKPFHHPKLGVYMQPLPFIEYSLENLKQAVLFSGETVILVNVPDPARYALHKLIVYGERKGEFRTKGVKDLEQSAALLSFLASRYPSDVDNAWKDLVSRGKGWRARVQVGLDALGARFPALEAAKLLRLPKARATVPAKRRKKPSKKRPALVR